MDMIRLQNVGLYKCSVMISWKARYHISCR